MTAAAFAARSPGWQDLDEHRPSRHSSPRDAASSMDGMLMFLVLVALLLLGLAVLRYGPSGHYRP